MTKRSMAIGGNGKASNESVMTLAVPSRANTAPNTFEATARNSTMLDVVMGRLRLQERADPVPG
jgi:hypothetical protein